MKTWIIPLNNADYSSYGGKAGSLAMLINKGFNVPKGIGLSKDVYVEFIKTTGIREKIILELGRKRLEDMRWEEMWDAALRIRNMFVKTNMPSQMEKNIIKEINDVFKGAPLAIRSSSLAEDGQKSSYAGLHDSFVNIVDIKEILKCIRLVWASLWSDAALLYRKELSLMIDESAMAVVIQEMILGDKSGVAFCVDPNNKDQSIIESVYGLNKGLVDGDVEPDRYFLNRSTGKILCSEKSKHTLITIPLAQGVRIEESQGKDQLSLNKDEIMQVYSTICKLEEIFQAPQDVEWTFVGKELLLLQSRPITVNPDKEKGWYLSLRRSVDNLQKLSLRIENQVLPQMDADASVFEKIDLTRLSDQDLAQQVIQRKNKYDEWRKIYWDECIPFAHGVRLFGILYNDTMQPQDAYEFIDIIMPDQLKSMERNKIIEEASQYLQTHPESMDSSGNVLDVHLKQHINQVVHQLDLIFTSVDNRDSKQQNSLAIKFLKEFNCDNPQTAKKQITKKNKIQEFLSHFKGKDKDYAKNIIALATKSYQFRDDDNLYLGRIEASLLSAKKEAEARMGESYKKQDFFGNIEEILKALRFEGYVPQIKSVSEIVEDRKVFNARQLRGQPAGKGIARGHARVIHRVQDLFEVKQDEILVCDAIDPNMTFIIPKVSAIVERRGGMLIHGAIIAREYGLPCVTGIPQATEFIQTGDFLTVDGYYGIVINHKNSTIL